jgi:hypothetical protein
MWPAEKSRHRDPVLSGAVRSLQSDLLWNYREKWASFAYSRGKGGGISLQSRLRGGEGGIRTLGTGVSPYNGLAITRFHTPGVRNQRLTFGKVHLALGKMALFGANCATIVQPASNNRALIVALLFNGLQRREK